MTHASDEGMSAQSGLTVAIGALDAEIRSQLAAAVEAQMSELNLIFFTDRASFGAQLEDTELASPTQQGLLPLMIICIDQPGGDTDPDLLALAHGLARAMRNLSLVAISDNAEHRAALLQSGCVEALPLEDVLALIPSKLSRWVSRRR